MNITKLEEIKNFIIENFEQYSSYTNTDEGNLMYEIFDKLVHSRKISDWGREEDTDEYYGIDKNGWTKYTQICQSGNGPFEIIREFSTTLSSEEMFQIYLENKDKFLEFQKIKKI